ncbi:hypothetical protein V8C86DRAFT_3123674 [Haematococcus lacustris]
MEPPSAQQRAVPPQQINALALPSAVFELITSEAIRAGDGPNLNQASKACRIACLRTISSLSLNIDDMSYSGFLTHDNVMALRGRGLPMSLTLWQRRTHIDMKSRYLVEGAIGQLGHCPAIRRVRIVAGDYPYVDLNVDTWLAAKMMPNFPNVEHLVVEGFDMLSKGLKRMLEDPLMRGLKTLNIQDRGRSDRVRHNGGGWLAAALQLRELRVFRLPLMRSLHDHPSNLRVLDITEMDLHGAAKLPLHSLTEGRKDVHQ